MTAFYRPPDDDRVGYWEDNDQRASDGAVIVGVGGTKEDAEAQAAKHLATHEAYLARPPVERLRDFLATCGPYPNAGQTTRAVKALAEWVVSYEDNKKRDV